MHFMTGVAGRFFSALGDAKINVLAISQGSSERNISAVVFEPESTRALRAVHASFRLSQTMVRVGIVGMNEIGTSLLKLLEKQRNKLRKSFEIELQVCAVVQNSTSSDVVVLKKSNMGSGTGSISPFAYNSLTEGTSSTGASTTSVSFEDAAHIETGGFQAMNEFVFSENCAHSVIFDCTADENIGKKHLDWLKTGTNVVTANSSALAGPVEVRNGILKIEQEKKASYLREVTVGGGLPVISTLRALLNSGDQIRRLDGILSVTMSYVMHRIAPPPGIGACTNFDESSTAGAYSRDLLISPSSDGLETKPCSFSEAMREAAALGLTEENPIRDINNEYTARCLMVLACELGMDNKYDVAKIQSLSDSLVQQDVQSYSKIEADLDVAMKSRVAEAATKQCVPRHVFSIDVKSGEISIKIIDVPQTHTFATMPPSCECVRFFTERHNAYPLVVQGPSAGADSTASALLADLLNLMRKTEGAKPGELSRSSSFITK
jgi:aspartokinase/homoserine dehydrogenase 1